MIQFIIVMLVRFFGADGVGLEHGAQSLLAHGDRRKKVAACAVI